jgi:hypothetical protein
LSNGVPQVVPKIVKETYAPNISVLLLDLSDAAKLTPRRVKGLARIHPSSNEALLEHGQMLSEFVIEFVVQPRSVKRRPHAREKHSQHWI